MARHETVERSTRSVRMQRPVYEGHDLGAEGVGEPLGRPAPAIPMRETLRPVPRVEEFA